MRTGADESRETTVPTPRTVLCLSLDQSPSPVFHAWDRRSRRAGMAVAGPVLLRFESLRKGK